MIRYLQGSWPASLTAIAVLLVGCSGSTETPADVPGEPSRIAPAIPAATPVVTPMPTPQPTVESTAMPVPTPEPPREEPAPTPTFPPLRRTTQFVPLDDPQFVPSQSRTGLLDSSFVLGLDWKGEQRAYPLQMMAYHHIVNDTVGGDPTLVTF